MRHAIVCEWITKNYQPQQQLQQHNNTTKTRIEFRCCNQQQQHQQPTKSKKTRLICCNVKAIGIIHVSSGTGAIFGGTSQWMNISMEVPTKTKWMGTSFFFVLTFISDHGSDGSSSITMEVPKNQHVTPKCNKNNIIMWTQTQGF